MALASGPCRSAHPASLSALRGWTPWTTRCRSPVSNSVGGWRAPAWGHGYATEAALAALRYGFDVMGLPEIVAVTMALNLRSRAVMGRIGMTSDPAEDFDDPDVDEVPLRRHMVYLKLREPGN